MTTPIGKVYLVGAGPGDPGLITLRGFELLSAADAVLYDYLVDPIVLGHAGLLADTEHPRELICLGRHGTGRLLTQVEINERMIAAAKSGQQVVRLKGGDPAIFGRTTEEIAALEGAGIPYEVVPGVTAGAAASSYSSIPLTDRDLASCVAFVTGQQSLESEGEVLNLASLAKFPGTLVFYMGITTAPHWSTELIAHGKPAETPVAIVRRATFPDQEIVKSSLGELSQTLQSKKLRPPAIIIVGEVVARAAKQQWFTATARQNQKPLYGQTVLVTRAEHQAEETITQLRDLGATVFCQPAIHIKPPEEWKLVDATLDELQSYQWLVFSSANGVHYFFERLWQTGRDMRQLQGIRLAAIGPGTTAALANYHLRADLQPAEYRAEALAAQLSDLAPGQRVLLLRASRGREVLAEMLTAAGVEVSQVVVYRSVDVEHPSEPILAELRAGKIDWITVTSSAIARSLVQMFGDDLLHAQLAAISPLTAEALSAAGYSTDAVATEYTTAGLIQAIIAKQ